MKRRIPVSDFPGYIFWSFRKDIDLPNSTVIKNVILYGAVPDNRNLNVMVTDKWLRSVVEKIKSTGRFK